MFKFARTSLALALLSAAISIPSVASAKDVTLRTAEMISDRSILGAGDYFWNDTLDATGKISIQVNLATQMAYVYRGEDLIGATNISSGKAGFDTPQGSFTILGKEDNHWSKKYKADMPYTMWVTNDGVALHSGVTPGRKTSHGCVHLPNAFAALLYKVTQRGAVVYITDDHPAKDFTLESIAN